MKLNYHNLIPGENTRIIVIATFIGLAAGLLNIVFRNCVHFIDWIFLKRGAELLGIPQGGWHLLLLPLLPIGGMILLIPLSLLFPGEVNGYGLPKFLRKVNLQGGLIKARTIVLKTLSTALTIGSGNSAGVEGPIAQIGGAVGSQVGQFFRVSGSRMKVYIAAGAAGGIAGMFNAPIAGVFFASEIVLLGTFEISSFAALVVASSMSTVLTRAYFGSNPTFTIPDYNLVNAYVELPLYVIMALFVGAISSMYINVFYFIRDKYQALHIPTQLKPLTGALLIGIIGMGFPEVMGDRYDFIESVLEGDGVPWILCCLIFLKIIATSLTLGSGGGGGVFAPALFIGAMIGATYGAVVNALLPGFTAGPGTYASVGIGAFLAASTHAPMTAIFLLFEMTGNYRIIVPIMLCAIISTMVSRKLNEDSIDTVDFTREGIDLHEGRETAIMKSLKVGLAMTEDIDFVSERANLNQLFEIFRTADRSFYFPVVDDAGKLTGIVSLQDIKALIHSDYRYRVGQHVSAICNRDVIFLTHYDTLYTAIKLFDVKGIEEIPVVDDLEHKTVIGMVRRRDVINAYNREVLNRGISEKADLINVTH